MGPIGAISINLGGEGRGPLPRNFSERKRIKVNWLKIFCFSPSLVKKLNGDKKSEGKGINKGRMKKRKKKEGIKRKK